MSSGIFVTGTDTGVGKTVAACALLRAHVGTGLARGRHEAGRRGHRARFGGATTTSARSRRRATSMPRWPSAIRTRSRRRSRRTSPPRQAGVTIDLAPIAAPIASSRASPIASSSKAPAARWSPLDDAARHARHRLDDRLAGAAGRRHAPGLPQSCAAVGAGDPRARTRPWPAGSPTRSSRRLRLLRRKRRDARARDSRRRGSRRCRGAMPARQAWNGTSRDIDAAAAPHAARCRSAFRASESHAKILGFFERRAVFRCVARAFRRRLPQARAQRPSFR